MLTFLCRIQLGSARLAKTTQSRQRGRAVLLFRTTPAAIYTIARTGAMPLIGQERSRENAALAAEPSRSEEHTSELQSRLHLVCRLLLEKKNCRKCPHNMDCMEIKTAIRCTIITHKIISV